MLFALFDWFKTLKNLEKPEKNEAEIHAVFRKYYFPIMTMEFEGTILERQRKKISLLSQLLEKVSTKLDSARKVNHADSLIDQKVFLNRDFQSEAYIPSSISSDAEQKFIAFR